MDKKKRGHNSSLNKPPYSESYLNIHSNTPAEVLAEQQCNAVRTQVPPVFKRTFDPHDQFRELFASLLSSYAQAQIEFEEQGEESVLETFRTRASELIKISNIDIDIDILVESLLRLHQENDPQSVNQHSLNSKNSMKTASMKTGVDWEYSHK